MVTHLYIKVFVIHDAIAHISTLGLYHTDLLPRGGKPVNDTVVIVTVINLLLCDVNK